MKLWQRFLIWAHLKKKPKAESLAITDHRASFLFDNGKTRVMNILSYEVGEAQFANTVARCKANGDACIYLYTNNCGDGAGRTSIYKDNIFGGELSQDKIALMQRRMAECRKQGLWIVEWIFPDDNGKRIPYKNADALCKHIGQVFNLFDKYVSERVLALEADDENHFDYAMIGVLAQYLRTLTAKPIGCHQLPGGYNLSQHPLINRHYHQYGFNKSVTDIENITRGVKAHIKKSVIAAEYNLSSDSSNARSQGQAAMRGGADGTGCGR